MAQQAQQTRPTQQAQRSQGYQAQYGQQAQAFQAQLAQRSLAIQAQRQAQQALQVHQAQLAQQNKQWLTNFAISQAQLQPQPVPLVPSQRPQPFGNTQNRNNERNTQIASNSARTNAHAQQTTAAQKSNHLNHFDANKKPSNGEHVPVSAAPKTDSANNVEHRCATTHRAQPTIPSANLCSDAKPIERKSVFERLGPAKPSEPQPEPRPNLRERLKMQIATTNAPLQPTAEKTSDTVDNVSMKPALAHQQNITPIEQKVRHSFLMIFFEIFDFKSRFRFFSKAVCTSFPTD